MKKSVKSFYLYLATIHDEATDLHHFDAAMRANLRSGRAYRPFLSGLERLIGQLAPDLIIGGLIVSEVLARHTLLMIINPIPGQEAPLNSAVGAG
jgi:hypothetical protein